ncbi:MAG: GtrA family protein [Bacteroidaceae bacterium]|nr:GtrA family protein [Bacteroidaceae bacterium]
MRSYIQFVLSRLLGTGVDTLVLWLCSDFIFSGNYFGRNILSPMISFEFAVMSNFLCSYYWIWSNRIENKNARSFIKHFVVFNIAALSGFIVKMLFLLLFEHLFGWDVIVCNLVALLISGVLNFFIEKLFVFRKQKQRPEHELLNIEELGKISSLFRGYWGRLLARLVIAVCDVNRLNILYDQVYFDRGTECTGKLLRFMNCDYLMGNHEKLAHLPQGAFITISNQPYGALDAIVLIDMMGNVRSDFKLLASEMLSRIEPLSDSFVYSRAKHTVSEDERLVDAGNHLSAGAALGIFPSGVGSDYRFHPRRIVDREWDKDTIRFIRNAHLPIVPIRFLDRNSRIYYGLGLISLPLRLLRLPSELFNKNKGQHRVVVGDTITVEQQQQYESVEKFHDFLRNAVYGIVPPDTYVSRSSMSDKNQE